MQGFNPTSGTRQRQRPGVPLRTHLSVKPVIPVEKFLRIVSWVVILGSASALLYRGAEPLFRESGLPYVDAEQALGTMADARVAKIAQCVRDRTHGPEDEGRPDAETARATLSRANSEDVAACRRKVLAQQ